MDLPCLLLTFSFQCKRHRTYAQRLAQGFLQPQDRATKPPLGDASEIFVPTFPGNPLSLVVTNHPLGTRFGARLATPLLSFGPA